MIFFWINVELSVSTQQRTFLKGSQTLAPTLNVHVPCPLKMRSGRIRFHLKFGCPLCSIRGYNAIYTRRQCTGLSSSCSLFDCGETGKASGTKSPEFAAQRLRLMGRTDALVQGTQTLCSRQYDPVASFHLPSLFPLRWMMHCRPLPILRQPLRLLPDPSWWRSSWTGCP